MADTGDMTRTFFGLNAHSILYFRFNVFMTGVWQPTDTFSVMFDNGTQFTFAPGALVALKVSAGYTCGSANSRSWLVTVVGKAFHTGNSATVKFSWSLTSNGSSSSPSFGIKELTIAFGTLASDDAERAYFVSAAGDVQNRTNCTAGNYYNTTLSTCRSCDSSCTFCFGPLNTQCYSADYAGFYDGTRWYRGPVSAVTNCTTQINFTTPQCGWCRASYSLNPNGSCTVDCSPPLIKYGDNIYHICAPACSPTQYQAWNNSCINSCDLPLLAGTDSQGNTCSYPCGPSTKTFLYWNGSCLPSCPYSVRIENYYQFCDECPLGQYKYDNGSCSAVCQSGFNHSPAGGSLLCSYPCSSGQYFYLNGTCSSVCSSPFDKTTTGSYRICAFPCTPNTYLYDSGTCLPACDPPFIRQLLGSSLYKTCHFPCTPEEYLYPDQSCRSTCSASFILTIADNYHLCSLTLSQEETTQAQTVSSISKVLGSFKGAATHLFTFTNSGNPLTLIMNIFLIMPEYMKYLNINYPEKLRYTFDLGQVFSLQIIPDIPHGTVAAFPVSSLADCFERHELTSSFFVNFWHDGIVLALLPIILLIVCLAEAALRKCKLLKALFSSIKASLMWDYILALVISSCSNIALFSSFELSTRNLSNGWGVVSFLECLIMNVILLAVFVKMVYIAFDIRRHLKNSATRNLDNSNNNDNRDLISSTRTHPTQQLHEVPVFTKWKHYTIVFDRFQSHSLWQLIYMPMFMLRLYVLYAVVGYLYNYPLVQTCFLVLFNISFLLGMSIVSPFQYKVDFIECVVNESILLVINACLLILAGLDQAALDALSARKAIGDVIIWTYFGYLFGATLYMVLKLLVQIVRVIKAWRGKRRGITIQVIPATPENMGIGRSKLDQSCAVVNQTSASILPKHHTRDFIEEQVGSTDHHLSTTLKDSSFPMSNKTQNEMINRLDKRDKSIASDTPHDVFFEHSIELQNEPSRYRSRLANQQEDGPVNSSLITVELHDSPNTHTNMQDGNNQSAGGRKNYMALYERLAYRKNMLEQARIRSNPPGLN